MATTARLSHSPQRKNSAGVLFTLIALAGAALLLVGWLASTYNVLVRADQEVRSRWAQVENVYQRRADLVPNLVETVKGAAAFEQSTFTEVAEARAQVGQISGEGLARVLEDPQAFQRFQAAQQALTSSLSRLIAVSESNPDLKATANFRDLQAQLEGTENRIAIERMRFNESARDYNTLRARFPTMFVARAFGDRFAERPYFQADPGSQRAPAVNF